MQELVGKFIIYQMNEVGSDYFFEEHHLCKGFAQIIGVVSAKFPLVLNRMSKNGPISIEKNEILKVYEGKFFELISS